MAMELATVGPYLNDLPREKREQLLEKFAEKYFGKKNEEVDPDTLLTRQWVHGKGISTGRFLRIVERIAKIFRP